jgi:hypothetical protein
MAKTTRINIELPGPVHKAAKAGADANGQTLKGWVIAAIKAALEPKQ